MKNKPLLEDALKYLLELDVQDLITIASIALPTNSDNKQNTKLEYSLALPWLANVDVNILGFELMFYSYRKLSANSHKGWFLTSKANESIHNKYADQKLLQSPDMVVMEHIGIVRDILEQWYLDPRRMDTIIAVLTKIYEKHIDALDELCMVSTQAINQITNFSIILKSQIVTMKSLINRTAEQNKQVNSLNNAEASKVMLVSEINMNKQQLNEVLQLEQFTQNKIFSVLLRKLKYAHEMFKSKHRFMKEEFKIFLQERGNLEQDSGHSELSVANIYDLLQRIQHDISNEIEFGSYNTKHHVQQDALRHLNALILLVPELIEAFVVITKEFKLSLDVVARTIENGGVLLPYEKLQDLELQRECLYVAENKTEQIIEDIIKELCVVAKVKNESVNKVSDSFESLDGNLTLPPKSLQLTELPAKVEIPVKTKNNNSINPNIRKNLIFTEVTKQDAVITANTLKPDTRIVPKNKVE